MSESVKQYVCIEFVDINNRLVCNKWAVLQNQSFLDSVAITKSEMILIGGSVSSVLAVILAFVILAKASKTL